MTRREYVEHVVAPLRRHIAALEEQLRNLKAGEPVPLLNGQTREERAERVRGYIVRARGDLGRQITVWTERYGAR